VAHDELAPLSSDQDPVDHLPPITVDHGIAGPVVVLIAILFFVTIGALSVAWMWSEETSLHFWLVAQFIPVFYVFLLWVGTRKKSIYKGRRHV
jgi:hypothetical protein